MIFPLNLYFDFNRSIRSAIPRARQIRNPFHYNKLASLKTHMNHPTSLSKFKASFLYKDNEIWDSYWQNHKHTIPGTEEQKQSTLRNRVLKFFKGFKIDEQSCSNQRRDVILQNDPNFTVCSDALLLYGTEFLQNQKIKEYFSPYACEVKKIDLSHSLVCFSCQSQDMLSALFSHLIHKPDNLNMLIHFFSENNRELITWREITGYKELCFNKKLWARFITQSEGQQIHYHTFQSKDLQKYESVKQEFMKKMEKIYKKNIQINDNYSQKNIQINDNYSKKSNEKQCHCCEIKFNKLKEMLNCCHKTKHASNKHNKKRQKQRSRERSRDNYKKKNTFKFNGLTDKLNDQQPSQFAKNITETNNYHPPKYKKDKSDKINPSSSFISKIDKPKNEEEEEYDQLFRDMLTSMQKYDPFGQSPDIANMSIVSKMNTSKYSVYEIFSEEDDI